MSIFKLAVALLSLPLLGTSFIPAVSAQDATPTPKVGQPSEAEMMAKMMELARPGKNHELLAALDGTWAYTVKFAGAPGAALAEAGKGTAVHAAQMGGRYFVLNVTGKMLMPGADGKVAATDFQGMSIEGYDNVKGQFFSTWIDNMGTSIVLSEGTYDAATKTFTYRFEMEPVLGMKVKARQVVKILDADHHEMDWYESHGTEEVKTMEIDYQRQK